MMKVFTLKPQESWICDRLGSEWDSSNSDMSCDYLDESDVVWLLGSWCWKNVPHHILQSKKVVTTIHHIVPEKFSREKQYDFYMRDKITDAYHVPSEKTRKQVEQLTTKPIYSFPFWVNQNIWYDIPEKNAVREKYGIEKEEFVIGSFQRDTEGSDLKSPKLEKGPDLFCDLVEELYSRDKNITVLLAGWRRQYVIKRLKSAGIKFRYHELPDFKTINELYNCLDMYLVTSRYEGGPQAILECAASETPIVSTDVGIASEILSEKSLFVEGRTPKPDTDFAFKKVKHFLMPKGFENFRNMFKEVINEE